MDRVGPWLICVDAMDTATARKVGRILGENGVTAEFMEGSVPSIIREVSKLRGDNAALRAKLGIGGANAGNSGR